jgi:hypothetical protein
MATTGRARGDFNQYLHGPHPDARTNMLPYVRDIQRVTALPVFDIVSLVTLVHGALLAGLPPRPA